MIADQPSCFCSVWATTSETDGPGQPFFAQPDGIDVVARNDTKRTEYGRIVIDFPQVPHAGEPTGSHTSNGSALYNYDPLHVRVTDEEVFLNIKLSGKNSLLTLHAIRRIEVDNNIGDFDKFTTILTPMQPNLQRSKPFQQDVMFSASPKPVDFTCTEIGLSFITNGTVALLKFFQIGVSARHLISSFHVARRFARCADFYRSWRL
jgi:hypothetical protein